ncbi:MAG: hypothetical protein PHH44_03630 [bacterium]|jgi:hypothetical protein|nr:hypothetical protein [bacterium]
MAVCEILPVCIFFNDKMKDMPGTASFFKSKFCQGDNHKCARHMVLIACGRENVPIDLFPNQEEKANKIIEMHRQKKGK